MMDEGAALHPVMSAPSHVAPCMTERLAGPSPPSLLATKMELVAGSIAIPHGAGPTVTWAGMAATARICTVAAGTVDDQHGVTEIGATGEGVLADLGHIDGVGGRVDGDAQRPDPDRDGGWALIASALLNRVAGGAIDHGHGVTASGALDS